MAILNVRPEELDTDPDTLPENSGVATGALQKQSTFGETMGAFFKSENTIGSAISGPKLTRDPNPRKKGTLYDPTVGLDPKYQDDDTLDAISEATSDHERAFILRKRDFERKQKEVIANAPWYTQIAAGAPALILDPVSLAPGANIAKIAKAGKTLATAGKVGAVAAADQAAREVLLHQSQSTRTIEESATNIGLAGAGGAVVGGVIGAVKGMKAKPDSLKPEPMSSAGAAAATDIPPIELPTPKPSLVGDDSKIVGEAVVDKIAHTPNQRVATAKVAEARDLVSQIFEDPYLREGNVAGKAAGHTAEIEARRLSEVTRAELNLALNTRDFKSWRKQALNNPESLADELLRSGAKTVDDYDDILAKPQKYTNKSAYRHLITGAINAGQTEFSTVKKAADAISSKVLKPLADRGIRAGVFDAANMVDNYVPGIWNKNKLQHVEHEFKAAIEKDVRQRYPSGTDFDALPAEKHPTAVAEKMFKKLMSETKDLEQPWEGRTALISREDAAAFYEGDINALVSQYIQKVAPTIALAERGISRTMKEVLERLDEIYSNAKIGKTQEEINELVAEHNQMVKDVKTMKDRMFGVADSDKPWTTDWLEPTRKVVAAINLPNMAISSFTDVGRLLNVAGFNPMASTVFKYFSSSNFRNMAKADAQRIGVGLEHITNTRHMEMNMLTETVDDFSGKSKAAAGYGKFADTASDMLTKVSMMSRWNSMAKTIAGTLGSDRMMEVINNYASASQKSKQWLAKNGIGETEIEAMSKEFKKYGQVIDGYHNANTRAWDNQELAELYNTSVFKIANETINTPTAGTLPSMMDNEAGKWVMQFKTFVFANTDQTLIAGLQQNDANTYMSFATIIGLGAAIIELKRFGKGEESKIDDPAALFGMAIDQAGILGTPGMIAEMAGAATGAPLSMSRILGGEEQRYKGQDMVDVLSGPSGRFVNDIGKLSVRGAKAATDEEVNWRDKDTDKLVKQIPVFGNLMILREAWAPIKDQFNTAIGAEITKDEEETRGLFSSTAEMFE